ncbi:hypothetical protein PHMEG_00011537 [Phytophthora megakarya]|uniref:Integrase catalytic domain-containing protein n=1 Tax=Phytophthora megakarya TaxID=4795 RepID=A0A225WAZ7_9STRA|nr:hypothetical protein PHMEG_00011537 [Phytophthora megakarya]
MDWHSRFGAPHVWVSDNGSHFKNEVVKDVSKRLNSIQNFTLAYSPWINGSVERLNKDIVQVLRSLSTLQANLNHTPVPSLGNHAPVEVFCVLPAASPLDFYLDDKKKRLVDIVKPNFDVGDYVLRSRVDQKHNDKLLVTWIGPYQVVQADEHSFRVKHLVTGTEHDVHSSRLKFYADDSFEVTEEIREHVAAQGIMLTVAELIEHRWNNAKSAYEILVSWKGLEPIEDSWETLPGLCKDIPVMVKSYAVAKGDELLLKAVHNLH